MSAGPAPIKPWSSQLPLTAVVEDQVVDNLVSTTKPFSVQDQHMWSCAVTQMYTQQVDQRVGIVGGS